MVSDDVVLEAAIRFLFVLKRREIVAVEGIVWSSEDISLTAVA